MGYNYDTTKVKMCYILFSHKENNHENFFSPLLFAFIKEPPRSTLLSVQNMIKTLPRFFCTIVYPQKKL